MKIFQRSVVLCLVVLAATAGCQRGDRLDQVVSADSAITFLMWRTRMADNFSVQERRDFDAAVEEIRLGVMLRNDATGSAPIGDAVRAKMAGITVRATLALGTEAKWQRLQKECRSLEGLIRQMSHVRTNPGDEASAEYLAARRQKHLTQLQANRRELEVVEGRLKQLLGDDYVPTVDDPDEKPQLIPIGAKA